MPSSRHGTLSMSRMMPALPLVAISTLELANFIGERLLRDTDAASMAVSLEARVPLLDHAVIDLVADAGGPGGDAYFHPVVEFLRIDRRARYEAAQYVGIVQQRDVRVGVRIQVQGAELFSGFVEQRHLRDAHTAMAVPRCVGVEIEDLDDIFHV